MEALRHLISIDNAALTHAVTWEQQESAEKWLYKVPQGSVLWCQLNTYMIVSIRPEALTHIESIMSAGRLHTNYEQHQQMTACTYWCFPVSCPYAVRYPSQVGSFRAVFASAPLKWQQRWRGTNTQSPLLAADQKTTLSPLLLFHSPLRLK